MSSIALYLAGGLLLASCLLRILFDGRTEEEFSNPLCGTGQPSVGALSDPQLSAQLFGSEDWRYVAGLGSKTIKREFLRMRKTLALAWVHAARVEAAALIGAHRAAARTNAHVNFFTEVRVTAAYTSFLFFCMLFDLVIRIRGPVALQALANLADSQSERLYEIVGQIFPVAENFRG
jgi:hypothetical protein